MCALKIVESQLLAGTAAANGNADAAQARIVHLEAELAERKAAHVGAHHHRAIPDSAPSAAKLQASLTARETELYTARSALLESRQAAQRLAAQVESLEAQCEERARQVRREKDAASASLAELREELTAQHCQEREALTSSIARAQDEIAALKGTVRETVRNMCSAVSSAAAGANEPPLSIRSCVQEESRRAALGCAEGDALDRQRAAVLKALESTVPDYEHAAALDAQRAAEARADELAERAAELSEQLEALAQELSRAQADALGLRDAHETSEGAVAGLQATLAKIEAQVGRGGGGGRRGAQEDVQLSVLSRQIVHAKLAEADAQRKVKIGARQELEHRQRIAAQAERITALKEELASARRGGADRARPRPPAGSPDPAARGRVRSASQPARRHTDRLQDVDLADVEAPVGSLTCAAMRIELAKKAAEIEYLSGALAEAHAAQEQPVALPDMFDDAAEVKSELLVVRQSFGDLKAHAMRCGASLREITGLRGALRWQARL